MAGPLEADTRRGKEVVKETLRFGRERFVPLTVLHYSEFSLGLEV